MMRGWGWEVGTCFGLFVGWDCADGVLGGELEDVDLGFCSINVLNRKDICMTYAVRIQGIRNGYQY